MSSYNRLAITSRVVCIGKRYKTEGVILKRINYGEADRILTIYTKHYGKIRAIAKGVRKITSRKKGSLELFNHTSLFLARGEHLDVITEAQVINSFSEVTKDLRQTAKAFYFVELVDKFAPERQAGRPIFDLLVASLSQADLSVTEFEIKLLKLLGFWSDKEHRGRPPKQLIETILERKIISYDFLDKHRISR